jgi:hypothetical protein
MSAAEEDPMRRNADGGLVMTQAEAERICDRLDLDAILDEARAMLAAGTPEAVITALIAARIGAETGESVTE